MTLGTGGEGSPFVFCGYQSISDSHGGCGTIQWVKSPDSGGDAVQTETITIVDVGRGPQLSTSRITVQDLVPYFQEGCTYAEIIRWIPTLSADEIAVVERYYREHQTALDEEDKQIRAHVAEQVQLQRLRFPEESREARFSRMKETLRQRQELRNGQRNPVC